MANGSPAPITASPSVGVTATLGWSDGRSDRRALMSFSPQLSMLAAVDANGAPEPIAVDQLAYLGFFDEQVCARPAAAARLQRLKLHVAGGRVFTVDALLPEVSAPIDGFFAFPVEPNSLYRVLFFYRHAIKAIEKTEPLGQLLIADRAVAPDDVARGVARQQPPLGEILVEQQGVSRDAIGAALELQDRKRLRLGEVLIEMGQVTRAAVERALAEQKRRRGRKLGEILVEMGVLTEAALTNTLARKFHLPMVDLDTIAIAPECGERIPDELIQRYGFLPIASDARGLTIAISDPLNTEISDVLRFQVPEKRIQEVLARPSQLAARVKAHLDARRDRKKSHEVEALIKEISADESTVELELERAPEIAESDSAIIKLANQIIVDGIARGASDIHVEPRGPEHNTVVRFRVDGECSLYQQLPPRFRQPLVARLKIMAQLDISERRKPQDGKIVFRTGAGPVELRVATIPTVNQNEDVVMRILTSSRPRGIDAVELSARNLEALKRVAAQPHGLILCVGPTGSGKTTTLHSILGLLNTPSTKIWTAEDPVEITQEGLRQVQVQPKVGFDFAAAMRAFLRADPDVIMVGEMRDEETAATAIEASLTGHLVLSTLHTNRAAETITRLLDMGLDPFNFADSLLAVLAQRLARRLCAGCREPRPASSEELEELRQAGGAAVTIADDATLWTAAGCARCHGSGYAGRIALHELLVVDGELRRAIQTRQPAAELLRLARAQGMTTLLQDGVAKVLTGETDLRQVTAVCQR
jgi:type II secretory ATPase GspE/PulE/Tfp pilus assembly ATPase PilB-like protein